MVKRLSTMQETWLRSLGREDPLAKEMAIHSSTIAWKSPWTEERRVSSRPIHVAKNGISFLLMAKECSTVYMHHAFSIPLSTPLSVDNQAASMSWLL